MDHEALKKIVEKTVREAINDTFHNSMTCEHYKAIFSDQSEEDIETIEYKNVEQESINPGLPLMMMGLALL